jgi:hypothetical protein
MNGKTLNQIEALSLLTAACVLLALGAAAI